MARTQVSRVRSVSLFLYAGTLRAANWRHGRNTAPAVGASLWLSWLGLALWCLPPTAARAQSSALVDQTNDPHVRPENGYWSVGVPRWFVSTKSELGTPYVKPYFSVGYGQPHWIWGGVDANAILTTSMAQVYSGLRASSPVFDLAFGARNTWSFDKPFLTPAQSFDRQAVLDPHGPRERTLALEFEAQGIIPLPHAAIVADFVMVDTLNLPRDRYLYDESYRLVTRKPFFCVARLAALARFLHENALKIGVLSEYGFNTGRERGVFRLGPLAMVQVTDHIQIAAGVTVMVASPDHLGLMLGAYGIAGIRYQWATGERRHELPWQGDIIPFMR